MIPTVRWSRKLKPLLVLLVVVLLPFLGIGLFYLWYSLNACTVVVRMPDIARAGLQFKITETYCSTLGEDAAISVFGVSQPGGSRTLLFKYGPESDEVPLPRIDVSDGTITMTVPVVSDTSRQIGTWQGRRVVYEIGRIRYPPPPSGDR